MSTPVYVSVALLVVFAALIFGAFALSDRGISGSRRKDYDERQRQMHNLACKWSFYTLVSLMMSYAAVIAFCELPVEPSAAIMLATIVAIGVYAFICIVRDAYISLRNNYKMLCIMFACFGVGNLFLSSVTLLDGGMFTDGRLNVRSANLALGVLSLALLVAMLVHQHRGRSEEE